MRGIGRTTYSFYVYGMKKHTEEKNEQEHDDDSRHKAKRMYIPVPVHAFLSFVIFVFQPKLKNYNIIQPARGCGEGHIVYYSQ